MEVGYQYWVILDPMMEMNKWIRITTVSNQIWCYTFDREFKL